MATPAPACRKALADATHRWPTRDKLSDGIMGDARHMARKSDHNQGNAVDVTHDPLAGCDGALIAAIAIQDPRVTYVICNRHIYNRARAAEGWRAYHGTDPHTHHCHVSIHASSRDDESAWGWASEGGAIALPEALTLNAAHAQANGSVPSPGAPVLADPPGGEAFPGIELRQGSKGTLVRRVQQRLHDLHWELRVDGTFGSETDRVVRRAQLRLDVQVDGIVGRRTWRAMFP